MITAYGIYKHTYICTHIYLYICVCVRLIIKKEEAKNLRRGGRDMERNRRRRGRGRIM